jgi:hypothetical protein
MMFMASYDMDRYPNWKQMWHLRHAFSLEFTVFGSCFMQFFTMISRAKRGRWAHAKKARYPHCSDLESADSRPTLISYRIYVASRQPRVS